MRTRPHLLLAALVCAALAGCAAPGAPQQTTDGQNIRRPGPTRICRSLQPAMVSCAPAGELPPSPASEKGRPVKVESTDTLPPELQRQNPAGFASYAVEALNARDRRRR